ncbi:hypothetical protein PISL3812_02615 [Talaromyces islandicus]|uniref:Uncharacterized protein n=1 Tax=Talaromyces islandicus TaxID=28573 RepID=A0A0U1LQD3_TALIS|nr:hypothetical protein PISL3812_02615 [Talaromyces islandicus]
MSNTSNRGDKGNKGSCLRCLQSGSDCFYSPQRKPGRPSLSQPTSHLTAAALPESAARASNASTPSSLNSLARMSDDFLVIGEFDTCQSLPTWLVEGNDPSRHQSVDAVPGAEDWPFACVSGEVRIGESQLSNDLNQISRTPFSANTGFRPSAYNKPSAASRVGSDTDHSHHSASTSSAVSERQCASDPRSPMDTIVQELAELNMRISRLTRSASIWNSESLPSVNSPIINELFGITNSLVFALKQAEEISDLDSNRHQWTEKSNAPCNNLKHLALLEDGVALMALSCHQQVLSAFDKLYSIIYRHLVAARSSSFSQQQKFRGAYNSQSPSPGSDSLEFSSTAQSIMIMNLLNHLISCLDSAIAPIGQLETISPAWGSGPSSLPSGVVSPVAGEEATADAVTGVTKSSKTRGSRSYADITTVGAILDAMKRRRTSIDEHKRQLKIFLTSSTNL